MEISAKIVLFFQKIFAFGSWPDFWLFVSNFGIILGISVFVILYICIDRSLGSAIFYSFMFSLLLSSVIKIVFREPRPFLYRSDIKKIDTLTTIGYSFPSLHCTFYTSFNVCLLYRYRAKVILFPFIFLNILILISRVVLGAHYLHDCIAGVIFGLAVGLIVAFFYRNHHPVLNKTAIFVFSAILIAIFALNIVYFFLDYGQSNILYIAEGLLSFIIGDNLEKRKTAVECAARVLKKIVRLLFFVFSLLIVALIFYPFVAASKIFIPIAIIFLGFYITYFFTLLAKKMNLFENINQK